MKKIIFIMVLAITSNSFGGNTYVRGYVKRNGTYVKPHFKTIPNNTLLDNYSTKGNINPYTGKKGTIDPYSPNRNRSWNNNLNNTILDD